MSQELKFDYEPGALIDEKYRVLAQLDQGGMGTVYKVEDITIGKEYALKTLNREHAERQDLIARMRAEARMLVRVRHPNIVPIITLGETKDEKRLLYYVMDFLEGKTLRKLLTEEGKLEPLHALDIVFDVLHALEKAHSEGIIHRDIKPDNVFIVFDEVRENAKAMVLDFGIAGDHGGQAPEDEGQLLGTPRYAPPEQIKGLRATPQSDLYAVGVMLYLMLAGHGPWPEAKGPVELASAHLYKPAPPLSKFIPGADSRLVLLLDRLLQKNIPDRCLVDEKGVRRLLTATLLKLELRAVYKAEEEKRQALERDENRTWETLVGVVHRGPASDPNATVEDPLLPAEMLAQARATTLVGLAAARPVHPPAQLDPVEQQAGDRLPRAGTPTITARPAAFPSKEPAAADLAPPPHPDELLARLGSPSPQQEEAGNRPMPSPLDNGRRPASAEAEKTPGTPTPDSWQRVREALPLVPESTPALPHGSPEPPKQRLAGTDPMPGRPRVRLVGPAAGRPAQPAPERPSAASPEPSSPSGRRSRLSEREVSELGAARTVTPHEPHASSKGGFARRPVLVATILGVTVAVGVGGVLALARNGRAVPASASTTTTQVQAAPPPPETVLPAGTAATVAPLASASATAPTSVPSAAPAPTPPTRAATLSPAPRPTVTATATASASRPGDDLDQLLDRGAAPTAHPH